MNASAEPQTSDQAAAEQDSDVVIETRGLGKTYRDFWGRKKVAALKSLDIEVKKGEIFGLLGPNGSGKSTTIKLVQGLIFPTSGRAFVFGKEARDVTKNERIGYLPEESYLYKFLNAEETLDFYGRLFDMPADLRKERSEKLIRIVGLQNARRRQLKEYSKGMTRRIGLAQALINEPDLLILDEPTTGMDPIGSREMKDLIMRLRDEGAPESMIIGLESKLVAKFIEKAESAYIRGDLDKATFSLFPPFQLDIFTKEKRAWFIWL